MSGLETRFSGNVPENYDRGLGPFIFDYYAKQMASRCASLAPEEVLETAAGTGIVTKYLRDCLSSHCSLIATDLNPPMLDYAAGKFGNDVSVQFEIADACQLPFGDGRFDAVVCQFGVMFFPDRQAGYKEALRVLKRGGTYLFSVWDEWAKNPFAEIAYNVGAEFFRNDPPEFYKIPFSYSDTDAIENALKGAGFCEISVEAVPHRQTLSDISLFAHGIVYGNPLYDELLERNIEPQAFCQELTKALRQGLGESMPLNAKFIAAMKH